MKKERRDTVTARGSRLTDLFGAGRAGAARILCDVGDVARFPERSHTVHAVPPPDGRSLR